MTAPDQGSQGSQGGQGGQDKPADGRKAPKVDVLTVGRFTHHDHLLGRDHTVLGVVAAVGDVLTVRPLEGRYVQVDPADFTPLSADDV